MIPKFRAWHIESKTMHEVATIDFEQEICNLYVNSPDFDDEDYIISSFKDIILMQSTGLKDKNGVEIFEGDILKIFNHNDKFEIAEVKQPYDKNVMQFDEESWDSWIESNLSSVGDHYGHILSGLIVDCYSHGFNQSFEIIGNRYLNPELLK